MAGTSNEMTNFEDLTVDQRVEGKLKVQRTLMVVGYVVIPVLFMMLLIAIGMAALLIIFIPLFYGWAFHKFVIPYTWCYVTVSYNYTIKSGKFKAVKKYGNKKTVDLFAPVSVSEMTAIAPYKDEYRAAADASDIENRYEICAFLDHPDNYYFTWKNVEGKKCVCIFQATNNAVKIMKFHNRETVVTEVQKISALA